MPGVVVEVAYSESTRHVSRKAFDYLTYSCGGIQTVIGLDAHYHASTFCVDLYVWTPTTTIKKEICKGDSINSDTLVIPLSAFGPPDELASEYPEADLDKEIILSFEELTACFREALMLHEIDESSKSRLISIKE